MPHHPRDIPYSTHQRRDRVRDKPLMDARRGEMDPQRAGVRGVRPAVGVCVEEGGVGGVPGVEGGGGGGGEG